MTGYFQGPRALTADESEPVRALVLGALGVTPYVDRVLALVAAAERGDADSRALVVERDGTVAGLVLYGPVAGTRGTWRLNMILIAAAVDARDVGAAMLDALVDACHGEGARLLVAELPADPVIGT